MNQRASLIKAFLPSIYCLSLVSVLWACSVPETQVEIVGRTMGTGYSIQLRPLPAELTTAAIQRAVDAKLEAINASMSTYRDNSELMRFNHSRTLDWWPISSELFLVIKTAQQMSATSGGAFDISVGPAVKLWGFGRNKIVRTPSPESLERVRTRIGWGYLQLREAPPAIRKTNPEVFLDLSAIAKGFAVDVICNYLVELKVENYLVEIGGELRGRGRNKDQQPWRIAIEKPLTDSRQVQQIISPPDMAVATSGDYRNFYEIDGKRYSHTINPQTASPVEHRLAAVTVLHESAMWADAWATSLLVLGPEEGYALAEQTHLAAYFISREGDDFVVKFTQPFAAYMDAVKN